MRQIPLRRTAVQPRLKMRTPTQSKPRLREGMLILVSALALFFLIAMVSYHHSNALEPSRDAVGRVGFWIASGFFALFGHMAYAFPPAMVYAAWLGHKKRFETLDTDYQGLSLRVLGFTLALIAGCGLFSLHGAATGFFNPGGILGKAAIKGLINWFSYLGTALLLLAFFFSGITLATGFSWLVFIDKVGQATLFGTQVIGNVIENIKQFFNDRQSNNNKVNSIVARTEIKKETRRPLPRIEPEIQRQERPATKVQVQAPAKQLAFSLPVTHKEGSRLPPLTLLDPPEKPTGKGYSHEELEKLSREVELRLQDFGVEVQVVAVHPGPVVTRFEMQLAAGLKVSRITALAKDLARSLSAISVRIVEVIPGKSVVGLELPNKNREIVRLSEVLASPQYEQARSPLSLALGKDIAGHPVIVDLGKMPHLLVAGTTGAGKSVGLNAMLLSLLYKATPEQVRLVMIDPKMLELSIYEGIAHLLAPVVTDMKEAANALRWCVAEMDRRYKLMATMGVRNLAGYNLKVQEAVQQGKPLLDPFWKAEQGGEPEELTIIPFIVVVVDEFADMIMVVGKKVEELIARIAQKARAAGIHLILATQRPSVDVITGLIKANIPTRIAFQVSSKIDSRTILDQQGAEQLLGYGDMLYLAPGTGVPVRVHGAYVADHEVHAVVQDIKQRGGPPDYLAAITQDDSESDGEGGVDNLQGERDPLYDQAVQIVLETRRASISHLQRRLKIGYNRAACLVEEMENAGIVSPMESNGNREILVPEGNV